MRVLKIIKGIDEVECKLKSFHIDNAKEGRNAGVHWLESRVLLDQRLHEMHRFKGELKKALDTLDKERVAIVEALKLDSPLSPAAAPMVPQDMRFTLRVAEGEVTRLLNLTMDELYRAVDSANDAADLIPDAEGAAAALAGMVASIELLVEEYRQVPSNWREIANFVAPESAAEEAPAPREEPVEQESIASSPPAEPVQKSLNQSDGNANAQLRLVMPTPDSIQTCAPWRHRPGFEETSHVEPEFEEPDSAVEHLLRPFVDLMEEVGGSAVGESPPSDSQPLAYCSPEVPLVFLAGILYMGTIAPQPSQSM